MDKREGLHQRKKQSKVQDTSSKNEVAAPKSKSSLLSLMFIVLCIFLFVSIFGYMKSPVKAQTVEIQFVELAGAFEINSKLAHGKKIPLPAPESIEEDDAGNLYTGLSDGRLVKIHRSSEGIIGEGRIENITTGMIVGAELTDVNALHGRPLGLRLRGKKLYVMDAYYGFYFVDLETRAIEFLVKPSDTSPRMAFPDDLDITIDEQFVYFTDASSLFSLLRVAHEVLEGSCTGRLLRFNLQTKELQTIVSGLCFANGVQLTKDEKMVIVPETGRYRVSWIDVKTGDRIHVLNVPAMPDNVRRTKRGTYWVGATTKLSPVVKILYRLAFLRQIVCGLLPYSLLLRLPDTRHSMIFEVDDYGNILSTLHDPNGDLTNGIAQATDLSDGRIALGTYSGPHLALAERKD